MSWKVAGFVLIALLAASPGAADDSRGGEAGVLIGVISPDEEMTGDTSSTEVTAGLRGGSVFATRWGWYIDALYSDIGTTRGLGNARTVIGRTGMDYLFTPERDGRWFVTFGAGWMVVDYEDAAYEDFHNPIASLGFGQRIRLRGTTHLRWELRGDRTLDHARLADNLFQGHAMLGLTWGPRGAAPGAPPPMTGPLDTDGDGVRDRRDRCPGTPRGALVDPRGCAVDDDLDGVPNGIDRCPQSRAGTTAGPDGCPADGDGDGVADVSDVCADTPSEARVDEWGCPTDADADSVYDGLDRCPDTPRGARVDLRGCPSDADGDGVYDGLDRCPRTPAGAKVDSRGCVFDTDGDGVRDDIDACPDTAENTPVVDARGCARTAPLFEEGRSELVLKGVRFETDGATLTADSRSVLDRVARSLRDHPAIRVEIGGHTDSTGRDEYNLQLSTRRAEAVRTYLVRQGIGADRLVARGYGETRPIADNATADGRARNRRVELKRIEPGVRP
jgi:OOP family OmpA-OmpF porin